MSPLTAVVRGAAGIADQVLGAVSGPATPTARWHGVTVLATPEQIAPGGAYPAPLAELGELVELRMQPASRDRGTELAARLRAGDPTGVSGAAGRLTGDDPRQRVRSALRQAKQLVEVGEVLRVDPAPHGQRRPLGEALGAVTRRAGGEGVL